MLTQLSIRNFTLIEHLELELDTGMTVISGETGAGKSIILDALGLSLGDRADSDLIRQDCERADISACFDISQLASAREWLQQQDLDNADECLLRRVISRNGRSRAYINGHPAPLQNLRELGEFLIDIHGQHEHQTLLKKENHCPLLDGYGDLTDLASKTRSTYKHWKQLDNQLKQIQEQTDEQRAQVQLLSYQVEELNQLSPLEGETRTLESEQKQLASAEELLQTGDQVRLMTTESDAGNCRELLNQSLLQLSQFDLNTTQWTDIQDMLNTALIQVEEASAELEHFLSRVEVDPNRLEAVDERLSSLYQIARKHQIAVEQLPELHNSLADKLSKLSSSEENIEELADQAQQARTLFLEQAEALSQQRQRAAGKLSEQVNLQLKSLGMTA
ncbi:MAG: AAA family ATPase, partial [Motiliproteus sp.]